MFSASRLLGGLVSHGLGRSARRAFGGGGMVGTAAKVAGVAAVGGAAYAAYRHYQAGGFGQGGPGLFGGDQGGKGGQGGFGAGPQPSQGQGQAGWTDAAGAGFGASSGAGWGGPPGPPPAAVPPGGPPAAPSQPTSAEEEQALLLVRAMIAAAHVDGMIDATERQKIMDGAANAGFGPEERQALERELAAPQPPNVLLGQVRRPDLAAQFYLVTLLAVDLDTEAERTYVKALPLMLQLPSSKVSEIHQQLGVPAP